MSGILADVELRTLMPRRSRWRVAQFDTLWLRLIKLAVRIEVLRTQVRCTCRRRTSIRRSSRAADAHAALSL